MGKLRTHGVETRLWTPPPGLAVEGDPSGVELLSGILHSLAAHILVLDRSGTIVYASRSWYAAGVARGADPHGVGEGRNYLAVCRAASGEDAMAADALDGISDVLNGNRAQFHMEYPCDGPEEKRWFAMRVTSMPTWHGGVVIVHTDITDRKNAEREAREMQLRYIMATGAGGVGVWDVHLDTGEMYVDPALKAMLGYLDSEIPNTLEDWSAHVHPDDVGTVARELERHLRGETALFEVEHRMVHRNGTIRWFLARGLAMEHREGRPRRVIGTDVDVTDRRRLALRADADRRRYHGIFEGAGVALLELDIERAAHRIEDIRASGVTDLRQYLVANPDRLAAIVSLVDVLSANAEAREMFDLDSRDPSLASLELDAHLDLITTLAAGVRRATVDGTARTQFGDRHLLLSLTRPDPADPGFAVLGALDVTENQRLQRTLEESRTRFSLVARVARTCVWSFDAVTETITFDASISEILGDLPSLRMTVEEWRALQHPEDAPNVAAVTAQLSAPDSPVDDFGNTPFGPTDYRVRHTDGSWRWISARGRVIRNRDGEIVAAHGVIVDITEKRNHAAALARANRAVRNLAGQLITAQEEERRRIAHELHDDVSQQVAAAAIEASLIRGSLGPEAAESLGRLESQLADLASVIRRLSHRMHPPALEGGLADSIRKWCDELRRTGRLDVRVTEGTLPATVPPEIGLCLFRIVQESLRNTIKHARVDSASIRLSADDDRMLLTVADRGVGFDVASRPTSGLGLVSMEERIRTLGGRLELRSAPGRGTTVRATVPLPVD